jgi:NTP pyrophosphatase (non-canonical NTP hydrolase)
MDIAALTEKAMALRQRFDDVARQSGRREWSKEEIMQGFVVDVGALMKLVMAKSGARELEEVDRKLAHELSDCLWSVLVLAKMYGIDLEKEFLGMLAEVSADLAEKKSTEPGFRVKAP